MDVIETELSGIDVSQITQTIEEINKQTLNLDLRPNVLDRFDETDEDEEADVEERTIVQL